MSVSCPSALASLDDSLALAFESLRKLESAESVDLTEVVRHFEDAANASRKLRALMSSEYPDASWADRNELEALITGGPDKHVQEESKRGLRLLRWARAR